MSLSKTPEEKKKDLSNQNTMRANNIHAEGRGLANLLLVGNLRYADDTVRLENCKYF